MTWRASVLTLFPEMFPGPLAQSLAGRALQTGVWWLEAVNIRDFARDRHRTVDDTPFGGGVGMVLRPDVVDAAIASVGDHRPIIFLTPRGRTLTQRDAERYAAAPGVILLCGRYEGVDQRVIDAYVSGLRARLDTGEPTDSITSARMKALNGAISEGLSTTVHPAPSAGATLSVIWCSG